MEVGKKFMKIVDLEFYSTMRTKGFSARSITRLTPALTMQILVRESVWLAHF